MVVITEAEGKSKKVQLTKEEKNSAKVNGGDDDMDCEKFPCTLCDSVWSNEIALKRHFQRIHQKSYVCQYCAKTFQNKEKLGDHEATHTGALRYTCEFCGLMCRSNGNYFAHKRKKHAEEYQRQKDESKAKRFLT